MSHTKHFIVATIVFGLTATFPAFAATPKSPSPPKVTARSWVIADAETGKILASSRPDEVRSIASLTKLMTYRVARDAGVDMSSVIPMQRDDEVGGGRLRLPVGTLLSVQNIAAATLIGSANNSANALARASGLSREGFIAHMNSAASSSGLIHTSFADVTGLDAGNVSTAREVLLMSLDTFKDPLVRLLTSSAKYPVSIADGISPPHPIGNTNMLVYDPAVKVIAGKTGFTYEAGYTLTTRLAKKGKKDLIVVVLGSRTKARSFSEGKALANWAWKYNLK